MIYLYRRAMSATWFFLAVLLLINTNVNAAPNPEYQASAWLGQDYVLSKMAITDNAELFSLPLNNESESIAVDPVNAQVWVAQSKSLTVYDFNGQVKFTAQAPPGSGIAPFDDAVLEINSKNSHTWLGTEIGLFEYDTQGNIVNSLAIAGEVESIAFDNISNHVWVATEYNLNIYNAVTHEIILSIPSGYDDEYETVVYDQQNSQALVGTGKSLKRYSSEGVLISIIAFNEIKDIVIVDENSIWVSTAHTLYHLDTNGDVIQQLDPFQGSYETEIETISVDPGDKSIWVSGGFLLARVTENGVVDQQLTLAKKIEVLSVYRDIIPPTIKIADPEDNALLNVNSPIFVFEYQDDAIGVDPATLQISIDSNPTDTICTYIATGASCTLVNTMSEGEHTIAAVISDYEGNVAKSASVNLLVDTIPPAITFTAPEDQSYTNQAKQIIIGLLSEISSLTLDNTSISLDQNNGFSVEVLLKEGSNTYTFYAEDYANNKSQTTLTVTLDTKDPVEPDESLIETTFNNGVVTMSGSTGSVESGSSVIITNVRTGKVMTILASSDGSFVATINGQIGDSFTIVVQDKALNSSMPVTIKLPNIPPAFKPIGDITLGAGQSIIISLDVVDFENDPLTINVNPLPLPANASFDSRNRLFSFSPTDAQVGSYNISFSVTDGFTTVTESFVITVPPLDPAAPTRFSAQILDSDAAANGQIVPIAGATISFADSPQQTKTDAQGNFTLTNLPNGDHVLIVDSTTAQPGPNGEVYASFRELFMLIDKADNRIERPIYIPGIDTSSLVTVNPAVTTVVKNDNIGVTFTVPSNTAMNTDGSVFTGQLSISPVPVDFAPREMPDGFKPGLLVTIQPAGTRFTTPSPITFPNVDNLPPGSELEIYSLDPLTGTFAVAAIGQVSADGLRIETISGGITVATWHTPASPKVEPGDLPVENSGDNCNICKKATGDTGSRDQDGNVQSKFSTPNYNSLSESRSLNFSYNSDRAYPKPIIPFDLTIPVRAAVPPTVSFQGSLGGVEQEFEAFVSTNGLSESKDETIRGATVLDGTGFKTGVYRNSVRLTSNYQRSRVSSRINGRTAVVNYVDSSFGAGWGIEGLSRLLNNNDGSVLIHDGSGDYQIFDVQPTKFENSVKEGNPAAGNWVLSKDGTSVRQTINGTPTFYVGGNDVINTTIRGTFRVNTRTDDDMIGFVVGYQKPTRSNGDANNDMDFVIFDWKRGRQTAGNGTFSQVGYSLSRVKGTIPTSAYWARRTTADGYTSIATRYGAGLGWRPQRTYNFEVLYEATRIRITIDGNVIFDVSGIFEPGRFGFYNYSQENVTYSVLDAVTGGFRSPNGDYSSLVQNPDGSYKRTYKNGTQILFDEKGLQVATVDRNGNKTTYAYDASDELISVTDPVLQVTTLDYIDGKLNSIVDPVNRTTRFTYSISGDLRRVDFPDGTHKSFVYDDRHLMTSESDKRGQITTRTFDFTGRFAESTLPDGTKRILDNAQKAGVKNLSAGEGSASNPSQYVRPGAVASSYTDGNQNGQRVKIGPLGTAASRVDAVGREYKYDRDQHGNILRHVRPNGSTVTYTYDDNGDVLSRTENFNNAIVSYTYDPVYNLVTSVTNPLNHKLTINRDNRGNAIQLINHLGHTTLVEYDSRGLQTRVETPNGLVSTIAYNTSGLLETLTETPPAGSPGGIRTTQYTYTDSGLLNTVTSPTGVVISYVYDALNRVISATDNLNQSIVVSYDNQGNVVKREVRDPDNTLAIQIQSDYDSRNRLERTVKPHKDKIDSTEEYNLGAESTLLGQVDPRNNSSQNTYDDVYRLFEHHDRKQGVTTYQYDTNNRITSITAPNGSITTFKYDLLGRRTQEISPDRGTIIYDYDLTDNVVSITDGRGIQSLYAYDELERVTSIQYPDATENITYTYDACPYGTGLLCSRTDESGKDTYQYDAFGNVISMTHTELGVTYTTSYQYDDSDNIISTTYPRGRVVTVNRDGVRRVSGITTSVNGAAVSVVTNMQYRSDNQLAQCTYANGLTDNRQYDLQGRLLNQTLGSVDNRIYDYDKNSNVLQRNSTPQNSTYSYDEKDRLILDVYPGDLFGYNYDANDNRVEKSEASTTTAYNYITGGNQLLTVGNNGARQYDLSGNLTDNGQGQTYGYNDVGRLAQSYLGSVLVATYTYNNKGQRTRKTLSNGDTVIYHYSQSGQLISETGADGTLIRDYIWAGALLAAQIDNNATTANETVNYVHPDHLSTPRFVTNTTGQVIWQWEGEAFGSALPDADVDGDGVDYVFNIRFPGQYYDGETGLHYNYFRYYDPSTGRYVTSDPIGLRGGLNTYGYVGGNPLGATDQFGLTSLAACYQSPAMMTTCIEAGVVNGSRLAGRSITILNNDIGIETGVSDAAQDALDIDADQACPPNGQDPCKGLRDQLKDHQRKLREYTQNPLGSDNRGFLRDAINSGNTARAQGIFDSRVKGLTHQINNFRLQQILCELKNGLR